MVVILVGGLKCWTQFWKGKTQIISAKFGWDWLSSFRGEDFFLISSPLFSIFSLVAILVGSRDHRTHFWKRTIQWLFHQNFVLVEQMVSDKKIFMGISHRGPCFGWDWLSSFRGEEFFLISSPLFPIFSLAAILVGSQDHRTQLSRGGHPSTIPPKFGCNWSSGFWGED